MRRVDSCQQDSLIDPFDFLGPKRKTLLETPLSTSNQLEREQLRYYQNQNWRNSF